MNEEARAKVERRRRMPAFAFLIGALLFGAVAVAAYLFWPDRAEAPADTREALITDDLNLPAPDAAAVTRQVDAALAAAPAASDAPATPPATEAVAPPEASGSRAPNDPPPPLPETAGDAPRT